MSREATRLKKLSSKWPKSGKKSNDSICVKRCYLHISVIRKALIWCGEKINSLDYVISK